MLEAAHPILVPILVRRARAETVFADQCLTPYANSAAAHLRRASSPVLADGDRRIYSAALPVLA